MTVGLYAPMPPARTGVADYAAQLLPALRRHGSVEVAPQRCAMPLYHLGNNLCHLEIYRRALERPGVTVLHDTVLHHFYLGWMSRSEYAGEFAYNYGEWSRPAALELWERRANAPSDAKYFAYPMLRRAVERAAAVVVHNPAAAAAVRRHAPGARVFQIPHLLALPPLPPLADALRFRQRLGIDPAACLFAVFGYLRESKRIWTVLEAFEIVRRERPEAALLLAGEAVSQGVERAIGSACGRPGVVRAPYLAGDDFWRAAMAADTCINLRSPAAGETSGIAMRLMGAGKPVLVTEGEETAMYPETACLRIAAGVAERRSLAAHMLLLACRPEIGREIGAAAAAYIRAEHAPERAAAAYWEVLCECSQ